ncbi:MAG: PHP domain-containing protein [Candidatus Riflebacteria bacterium]|nr:PHP domain-containing protein [Candidatus Riflebacteria bacterium]
MEKTEIFADLHLHSTASDGILSPTDLVGACKKCGLKAICLTDHDTIKGVEEASAAAKNSEIEFAAGIELSCGIPNQDYSLHVLGLFIDPTNSQLIELLRKHENARRERAFKILSLLKGLNVNVEPLRLEFEKLTDQLLARPHIARFLLSVGAVSDFQEAFEKFLKKGAPAYVPKLALSPEKGIEAIHNAGGLAFIAHPGLDLNWEATFSKVENLPWDGIEVFYGDHDPSQTEKFRKLAERKGWLMSGGSDYHGECGKHVARLGQTGLSREKFNLLAEASKTCRKK